MSDAEPTPANLAAEYARYGLRVFPVLIKPGDAGDKGPMPGYGWVTLATSNPNEVAQDFVQAELLWGIDHVGVGWALGLDRCVAIDLDIPAPQWPDWATEISGAAALNITKRGRHLIFRFPDEFEPGNGDSGFPTSGWGEVRGKHGYIIIAGPDRPGLNLAEFDHCQKFPHPEWLREFGGSPDALSTKDVLDFAAKYNAVGSMPNKVNGLQAVCDRWDPALEGDPARGRHPTAIYLVTLAAEEAIGGYYPFTDGLQIVKRWWRQVTPPERHKREWNGIVTWSVSKALMNQGPLTVDDPVEPEPHEPSLDDDGITIRPMDLVARWRADRTTKDWVVENLLPTGRSASLTAEAKAGKSELTLYLVACLAQGIDPWSRQPREPVRTAYFDYEMSEDDVFERLESFGFTADDDWSQMGYFLLPPIAALDTTVGSGQFMDAVDNFGPSLVVIDTLMRTLQGDENDALTFQAFFRNVGLGLKQRRITSLRLDHFGKDKAKGTRGSSAKDADVDVIWGMVRSGRYSSKLTSRSRVSWVPQTLHIERYANPHVNFMPRDQVTDNTPTQAAHEMMAVLDLLEIPLTWGRDKVRTRMVEAGYVPGDTTTLSEALRLRKARGPILRVVADSSDQDEGQ